MHVFFLLLFLLLIPGGIFPFWHFYWAEIICHLSTNSLCLHYCGFYGFATKYEDILLVGKKYHSTKLDIKIKSNIKDDFLCMLLMLHTNSLFSLQGVSYCFTNFASKILATVVLLSNQ